MAGEVGWTKEPLNMKEICLQIKMVLQHATVTGPIIFEMEHISKEYGEIIYLLALNKQIKTSL